MRKRFISVAGNGAPDKTASNIYKNKEPSPSCGLPVEDGIQFDIENCCNMVLCETVSQILNCNLSIKGYFMDTLTTIFNFSPVLNLRPEDQKERKGESPKVEEQVINVHFWPTVTKMIKIVFV